MTRKCNIFKKKKKRGKVEEEKKQRHRIKSKDINTHNTGFIILQDKLK